MTTHLLNVTIIIAKTCKNSKNAGSCWLITSTNHRLKGIQRMWSPPSHDHITCTRSSGGWSSGPSNQPVANDPCSQWHSGPAQVAESKPWTSLSYTPTLDDLEWLIAIYLAPILVKRHRFRLQLPTFKASSPKFCIAVTTCVSTLKVVKIIPIYGSWR